MLVTWIFYVSIVSSSILAKNYDFKLVEISQGPVKGYKSTEGDFYVFYGIPYATEPTGLNKYKPPLPGPTWTTTFEAVQKGVICSQSRYYPDQTGYKTVAKNCLVSNVYVPETEDKNLSVLVQIHGGAFQMGDGEYVTPKGIVQKGKIIVVNFNYRLGVQGFLCLGTQDIPGNAGMKDMVALLRWVKTEIGNFGGNPEDITVTGFSAGSASAEFLMLSKSARGLFHKLIPESGSATAVWSMQFNPIQSAKALAKKLNFETDDITALEFFFKNISSEQLNQDLFLDNTDLTIPFVPCIERYTGSEMFLDDAPVNIMKKGDFMKLPMLIGIDDMDGQTRLVFFNLWSHKMNAKFSDFLPGDLQFTNEKEKEEVSKMVKELYFGDQEISEDNIQGFVDYNTDNSFIYPLIRSLRLQLANGSDSVYLYEYTYADDILQQFMMFNVQGAGHCAQTVAVYESDNPSLHSRELETSAGYKKMKKLLQELWINFIKTGTPLPEASQTIPEKWPPVSVNATPYMKLNLTPKLVLSPLLQKRIYFWDRIYETHYRLPVPPM